MRPLKTVWVELPVTESKKLIKSMTNESKLGNRVCSCHFLEKINEAIAAQEAFEEKLDETELESDLRGARYRTEVEERLANYAHEAWAGWMDHLFIICPAINGNDVLISSQLVERWKRQIKTAYKDLPLNEQKSDIKEAHKMLAIVNG
jgi:hypothetical protein